MDVVVVWSLQSQFSDGIGWSVLNAECHIPFEGWTSSLCEKEYRVQQLHVDVAVVWSLQTQFTVGIRWSVLNNECCIPLEGWTSTLFERVQSPTSLCGRRRCLVAVVPVH